MNLISSLQNQIGGSCQPHNCWLPYIRFFKDIILDDMHSHEKYIVNPPSRGGWKVWIIRTPKTNTPNSLENFLYLSCFWTFCSKAFVSLLIQAEQYWSSLYTYLQCESIPVWILNTALKHFKKPSAKDGLIFSEKSTTLRHKLKSWWVKKSKQDMHFPLEWRPIQVYNFQHASAQQKLKVVLPQWLHAFLFHCL